MKIGIITGASAGLGKLFTIHAADYFPELEELWVIARRTEALEALQARCPKLRIRPMALDLCDADSFDVLKTALETEAVDVRLLINNAGCGYLNNIGDGPLEDQLRMVDLNLRALTAVTHLTIPHMSRGSRIVNISSIASFCPNPRMTVYSAGKSYVSAFSGGLRVELKEKGISVTAVCPGPMDTEFIHLGKIKGRSKTFDTLPYCDPEQVVLGTLKAAKDGRAVYTPKAFYKLYRVLAKLLPQSLMINFSKT